MIECFDWDKNSDPDLIGTLTVAGEGRELKAIAMIKSPTQRIDIAIRETKEDVLFTADTLRRFFR